MRRIFYRLAVAWIIALGFGLSAQAAEWNGTQAAQTQDNGPQRVVTDKDDGDMAPAPDPSLCLDEMETVPFDDDLEPVPIAVDGGCMVSEAPISI